MIEFQVIGIATGSDDREGRLVLADGLLVAVLVLLEDESHGCNRGLWAVEASFAGIADVEPPLFADLGAAEDWVRTRVHPTS
ncbi:hypothetical protein [Aurantimonas sp. Leaf443]|uniref:hypothetical protein n=1 Tax=Aurantimonas sp. Leaf443 TaxID=1736378 RepID=UPI0007004970|nr:hypothetical protein [Aurantimonas sp. Leaf443]KQT85385.1 hypothetical protein ASG48_09115 [Aurantimonas sp. Leaf443]